jgi:hypothetical protein
MECEDVWRDGMGIEPWSKWDSYFKDMLNCVLKTDKGTFVFIRADDKTVEKYIHTLPLFNQRNLPDGILTWILYSKGGDVQFAATSVQSAFEVGTAHKLIALRTKALRIHGAGELRKQGQTIQLNTQSGTYTLAWMESRRKKRYCTGDELEATIRQKAKEYLNHYTVTDGYNTFITKTIPVSSDELRVLKSNGFRVEEYADLKTCKAKLSEAIAQRGSGKRKTRRRRL